MTLDDRLRAKLAKHGAAEKRMFGGTCFLIGGNMAVGTLKDGLIVRVGKEAHGQAVKRRGARTFDMSGRPTEGFISVAVQEVESEAALDGWIDLALAFARTLPAKAEKPARRRKMT